MQSFSPQSEEVPWLRSQRLTQSIEQPKGFHPVGELAYAEFRLEGPFRFTPQPKGSTAKAAGMRYERKAHTHFLSLFPAAPHSDWFYAPAQWIAFVERGSPRLRFAQPDGLLFNLRASRLIIIEFKLRHTISAWWGLRKLYEPLIRKLFGPHWRYSVCEVVRWYDPAIRFPEPICLTPNLTAMGVNEFGVHIWGDLKRLRSDV